MNTQFMKFSTESVKGHGSEERLVEFKGILNLAFPQPRGSYRKAWEGLKEIDQRSPCYIPFSFSAL